MVAGTAGTAAFMMRTCRERCINDLLPQNNFFECWSLQRSQTDRQTETDGHTDRDRDRQAETNRHVVVVIASLGSIPSARLAATGTAHLPMRARLKASSSNAAQPAQPWRHERCFIQQCCTACKRVSWATTATAEAGGIPAASTSWTFKTRLVPKIREGDAAEAEQNACATACACTCD